MMIFKRWYFARLVLKLEISYNRVIIISWRILVSLRGSFWRLGFFFFAWWKYLSFHNSSCGLNILLKCKWQRPQCDTPPLFVLFVDPQWGQGLSHQGAFFGSFFWNFKIYMGSHISEKWFRCWELFTLAGDFSH